MTKLTETQIKILINTFFEADDKYAGAPSVAKTLLEEGECIVAGTTNRIWNGGVGNFISIKDAPGSWGCSIYTLDLKSFLSSRFVNDIVNEYISQKRDKVLELKIQIKAIESLIAIPLEIPFKPKNN